MLTDLHAAQARLNRAYGFVLAATVMASAVTFLVFWQPWCAVAWLPTAMFLGWALWQFVQAARSAHAVLRRHKAPPAAPRPSEAD